MWARALSIFGLAVSHTGGYSDFCCHGIYIYFTWVKTKKSAMQTLFSSISVIVLSLLENVEVHQNEGGQYKYTFYRWDKITLTNYS